MIDGADELSTHSDRGGSPLRTSRRRTGFVAIGAALFAAVFASLALAAPGTLVQKSGTAGCISEDGSGGDCTDGTGARPRLGRSPSPPTATTPTSPPPPAAPSRSSTATRTTGELTQKSGTDGCISANGTGGACTTGPALGGAASVAVSPDGKSAYVASSGGVAVFDRNTANGKLTQKAGTDACVSEDGSSGFPSFAAGACADGVALSGVYSVTSHPTARACTPPPTPATPSRSSTAARRPER